MEIGVHGKVMVHVQRNAEVECKQEVALVTILHLRMAENRVPVKVQKIDRVVQHHVQVQDLLYP